MAIELLCQKCSAKLRVPDEHAGKKARCPSCGAVTDVPSAERLGLGVGQKSVFGTERESAKAPGLAASFDRASATTAAERWYVKTPEGHTYGPVERGELDSWLAQGRLTGADRLLRDGQDVWQAAGTVFPALGMPSGAGSAWKPSESGSSAGGSGSDYVPINPYASPRTRSVGPMRFGPGGYVAPHRGGTILALGLVSLFCNVMFIPGIAAWTMAHTDLKLMNSGRMDPSGRGMTIAGMVLGIITTVLGGLWIGISCLAALAGG